MSKLPNGWSLAPLMENVDLHDSRRIPLNQRERAERQGPYPYYGANGQVDSINDYIFDGEFILLAEDGGYFDDPARGVAYEVSGKFWVNNHAHILSAKNGIPRQYLTYVLNQLNWIPHVGGSTRLKLTQEGMRKIRIPLAPQGERERIVAKLDSLFNRSKIARDNLAHVPGLVERFKLAILAAAFRGDTTAKWRTAHATVRSNFLIEQATGNARKREGGNTAAESSKRFQLPETWRAAKVESIGEVILGRQRSPENHKGPHMRPYVRAANITWDGWDLSDVKQMNFDEGDFERFKLQSGDVLINEGSGSADEVGKPAIWNDEIKNCCFQNTLIAVRPHATTPEYLYFVLFNAALSRAFVDEARGVNIHHIGRAGLAQFVIPVPPIEEQQEIARHIKAAFTKI